MFATIALGSCVTIQGIFVKRLNNGFVQVKVGDQLYTGRPVSAVKAA
ncbi:hypothetical protein KUV65_08870 [Maritalea mobilis]|nr:hypothetical protein [Maritalea mobilis]MBY6201471.1 hypothetical protein [Maritalea mobilis]